MGKEQIEWFTAPDAITKERLSCAITKSEFLSAFFAGDPEISVEEWDRKLREAMPKAVYEYQEKFGGSKYWFALLNSLESMGRCLGVFHREVDSGYCQIGILWTLLVGREVAKPDLLHHFVLPTMLIVEDRLPDVFKEHTGEEPDTGYFHGLLVMRQEIFNDLSEDDPQIPDAFQGFIQSLNL